MTDHSPSTDERASLAQPSQSSSPLECTSHLGFSLDVMSDRKIRYWIFCADFIAAVRSLVLTDELVAAAVCDLADRELLRQDPNGWRAEYLQVPFRYRPGVGSGDKGYSGRPDGNDPSAAGSHNIGAFLGIGGTPLASRSRDTLTTTKNSWRPVVGPATR